MPPPWLRREHRSGSARTDPGSLCLAGSLVEPKSLADLAGRLVHGSLTYARGEPVTIERAALVVEVSLRHVLNLDQVACGFVAELLAAGQAAAPSPPKTPWPMNGPTVS